MCAGFSLLRRIHESWTFENLSGLTIFNTGESKDASRLKKILQTVHAYHNFIAKL